MSQSIRYFTAAARSYLRPPTRRRPRGLAALCLLLLGVGQAGCGDLGLSDSGQSLPQETALHISPARCWVLCGVRVTIIGLDMPAFGPGTEVLFGEVLASDLEIVDAETIRVTAPAQAAGHVDVIVRLTADTTFTSTAGFEYVAVADADAEILEQIENMFPGAPALVSAVATSNTSVRVMFSEPMGAGARDPLNYSIVIAGGGVLKIDLSEAIEHSQDGTVLDLPTLSQAHALYEMTVTGIRDLAGHPIAPPDLMDTPAFTTFTGIAPGEQAGQIDSDGDGLPDWLELLGWPITIELVDGQRVQSYATSDPFNPDTDGDGVGDAEENARSMHPRSNDTDADLVLDADEIWGWRSNPNDQDTDDDGFSDMLEVGFGTSLILADTDGDQLDDLDELLNRNRNPHIADLPIVDIVVGEINLQLDERYTFTDQFGEEQQVQQSYSSTLQRDTSSSISETHSDVFRVHVEGKVTVSGGVEQGWGVQTGGKVHGGIQVEVGGGFAYERTNAWGSQSSVSTARTYNEAISRVSQISSTSGVSRETVGAQLSAIVTIAAASDIAFQISDIEISVLLQDPQDRSRLIPIATLAPSDPDAVYNVGPLVPEIGPLVFQSTDIFPALVEELMKDPRGLVFKVANFNITDEFERNFAFTSQEVVERTAMVMMDYGNGESETYRIATAGRFDLQGQPVGISMADALRAVGVLPWVGEDPELGDVDDPTDTRPKRTDADIEGSFGMRTVSTTGPDGETVEVRVITRVRGVQDDFDLETVEPDKPNDGGFWVVFVTRLGGLNGDSGGPALQGTTNFDEARLHAGESYILAFVKDKDQDDLTSLEEFFAGSSDTFSDTDSDDLGDFLEIRGQWNRDGLGAWYVFTDTLPGGYRAYSAPYLSDSDEDGLADDREYALCRYAYDENGDPPATAFAIGSHPDDLTNPPDDQVDWDNGLTPADLPDMFACEGLPEEWATDVDEETGEPIVHQWHTELDAASGTPAHFPTNRAALDPRKVDTDEDGISDADEVNGFYVDLFDEDPIGDNVRTRVFVRTDPLRADTDGDGLIDGMERQFGTNPVSPDSGAVFDDDLDGLPNRVEETGWEIIVNGALQCVYSNPNDPDSDNDGLPDYVEWILGTNPWDAIGQTPDPNLPAPGYDTDGDGLSDREEWDGLVPPQDQEKLAFCDLVPNCAGYSPSEVAHNTDPVDWDTDDDDISDGDELIGWTVHLMHEPVGYQVSSDPLNADTDGDGLQDSAERTLGTDPGNTDTDSDGASDGIEKTRVADAVCLDGACIGAASPCADDSDCVAGGVCLDGACVGVGSPCANDSECQADEVCLDGACVGGASPCLADTDCEEPTRDPLVPDQRLTVAYTQMNIVSDGYPGPNCGDFLATFNITVPGLYVFDLKHWDAGNLYDLTCTSPDDADCIPAGCLGFVRQCDFGDILIEYASNGNGGRFAFILPDGTFFKLGGRVQSYDPCPLDPKFTWDYGGNPGGIFTIPIDSQTFRFDTGPVTDSDGDDIELNIEGYIIVD